MYTFVTLAPAGAGRPAAESRVPACGLAENLSSRAGDRKDSGRRCGWGTYPGLSRLAAGRLADRVPGEFMLDNRYYRA